MSIEAIRELKTLASVCPELNMANYTEDDVRHLNDWAIEMSLLVERYALAQQPATPEPVLYIHPSTFEMDNAHVGAWKPGHELPGYIPLFTHPAPPVPDDVVRDAERFRWLRDRDHWPAPFASSQDPEPVRGIDLDAAIDAAMLAAK